MMRCGRSPSMAAWTLVAACSGGRNETSRSASAGAEAGADRLNLTVWRPKVGGAEMVGLSLETGETSHQIATVKGGQLVGSGAPGVRPAGAGGTLTVAGKDDHGDAIELSMECERFDEVVAEGG